MVRLAAVVVAGILIAVGFPEATQNRTYWLFFLGVVLVLLAHNQPGHRFLLFRRALEFCPKCKKRRQHLTQVTDQEVWICSRCGSKAMTPRRSAR